jgi:hypothetical protein
VKVTRCQTPSLGASNRFTLAAAGNSPLNCCSAKSLWASFHRTQVFAVIRKRYAGDQQQRRRAPDSSARPWQEELSVRRIGRRWRARRRSLHAHQIRQAQRAPCRPRQTAPRSCAAFSRSGDSIVIGHPRTDGKSNPTFRAGRGQSACRRCPQTWDQIPRRRDGLNDFKSLAFLHVKC